MPDYMAGIRLYVSCGTSTAYIRTYINARTNVHKFLRKRVRKNVRERHCVWEGWGS